MLSLPTSSTKMHSSKEYTMGYFYTDAVLFHADKRDKGMNSTTSEKGTDNKRNNSSAYNHEYYMKNKEKWQDNKKSGDAKFAEYQKGDSDFDDANYSEKNRLGDTDFFGFQKPDGSWVILEEDMKWTLPAGMDRAAMIKALEAFDKEMESKRGNYTSKDWQEAANKAINSASKKKSSDSGEKEFDVDAAAMDVIRGKYGNGAERKAALGEDYAEVQKRVNELMKQQKSSSTSKSENKKTEEKKTEKKYVRHAEVDMTNNDWRIYQGDLDYLAHHGIKGQKWGVRRFENPDGTLTAAGRKRYGEGADKIEKRMVKAAKYETKAANAKTALGREFNAMRAYNARINANTRADKAEGKSPLKSSNDLTNWAFGFDQLTKRHGTDAEVRASIAKKMKERADNETDLKKKSKIMEAAIQNLASAENAETYAKAYKKISESKGLINKGISYFEQSNKAREMKVTPVGRLQSKADKQFEQWGDTALNAAFGIATRGNVGVGSGFVSSIRDRDYKKKNTAEERWNAVVKNHKD